MPSVEFEPTIPTNEQLLTYALGDTATTIGTYMLKNLKAILRGFFIDIYNIILCLMKDIYCEYIFGLVNSFKSIPDTFCLKSSYNNRNILNITY